ncbi:bacteriocin immunity protein [Jinshanibacter sp. LJY008]|uniref:Bacteriocin immunity protein n=1 Tax=Limnobaculum eriocheiris TaxID=2897391 RepID=A0A9X1SJA3_9GAMM|nr:bacteriocin immunity protein [Limnobaculum eriocheiris]MCD1125313.1 bacteriocin immunity protein [Limnobaculum eriocheiris]
MISMKQSYSDYSKMEFLALIEEICSANGSEQYQDELLENFIIVTQYPAASDLIYYPKDGADDSPLGILETIQKWRSSQGLPSFKDSN